MKRDREVTCLHLSCLDSVQIQLTWYLPFLYSVLTPQPVIVLSSIFLHCPCELQLTACLFKLWVMWKSDEFTRNCILFRCTMSGSNIWLVDLQKICLTIPLPALRFQTDFRNVVPKCPISILFYLPHLQSTENTEDVAAVELHFTFQRHLSVRSLMAVRMYCFLAWHLHGSSIKYCLPQQSSCPDMWNSPFFQLFSCKHYSSVFLYSSHLHQLWFGTTYTQTVYTNTKML